MPSSRIPSPARSLGVKSTPRRYKQRRTRSVNSPSRSENTALTAILPDSFIVSPLPRRRSVLTDDTDVDMPKRLSWWKKLNDNSRCVIELLEHKDIPESNNIEEKFDVDILSQEKKNYTMDLPESSDGESISSIVIPQRKLFIHKENQPPRKFPHLLNNREELAKLQKSHVDHEKEIEVRPKSLFNNAKKPKSKPIFPSALLNISTDKSAANKTKEIPAVEPKGQVKNLFGNRQGTKRKNMFADFLVSESEDEIPEIQTKVFGFQNKNEQKRRMSAASGRLQQSPNSSIVDIDMDDWLHLPSSTMCENKIEEQAATPSKRTRLNKEMDTRNKSTKSNNRSKQFSSSKVKDDYDIEMENIPTRSEKGDEKVPSAELEDSKIETNYITNKLISPDVSKTKKLRDTSTSKNRSKVLSKSLNKSTILNTVQIDCNNDFSINKKSQEVLTNSDNSKCLDKSIVKNDRTSIMLGGDENRKIYIKSTNEIISNQTTTVNKTDKDKENTSVPACEKVDGPDKNDESFINHNNSKNENKKVPQSEEYSSEIAKNIDIVRKPKGSQSFEAAVDHVINHEVSKNLNNCDVSKIQESKEESDDDGSASNNNELNQSITEQSEQMQSKHSDAECQEHEPESENENESDKSQNEELENDNKESEEQSGSEKQSADEDEYELDIELDNHHESNIDHDHNELNEINQASYNSKTEIQNDGSTKVTHTTSFRSENKKTHETSVESPEVILNEKTKNFMDSFTLEDRNSARKTKSLFKQLTLRPSLAPVRESTGFSDNTGNSSANSGWDSHRTTRQTLRKTFGKDFTPRKSLRTLVMEKSAKRQTFNPDLKNLSKHPHANSTELPAHDSNKNLEENSVENSEEPMEVSSDEEREESEERVRESIEEKEETVEEREESAEETEEEKEETIEENEETVEEREETTEEKEETEEEREESAEVTEEEKEETIEENEETVEEREETAEEKEETEEENEETVEEIEVEREETVEEREEPEEISEEYLDEREESIEEREESIQERIESIDDIEDTERYGGEVIEERDHELSKRMRQTTLETFLHKIKKQELESHMKIREDVINSLKVKKDTNLFKYPNLPVRRMAKPIQRNTKPKVRQPRTPFVIPEEVLEDLKYKPPKRFQPRNASWATKRLYKFLETKLEPKYDYMARVRAEKLVETIYEFTKQIRRLEVAPHDAITSLKREMARLKVVDTHYEFYDFFHEYMPREIRVKVNPDPVNKIQKPKDVFANIIQ